MSLRPRVRKKRGAGMTKKDVERVLFAHGGEGGGKERQLKGRWKEKKR